MSKKAFKQTNTILDAICEHKREEVEHNKSRVPTNALKGIIQKNLLEKRDFKQRISSSRCNIIAEVKFASPSEGTIREHGLVEEVAKTYEENGACALSILTDERFFQGSIDFLKRVKKVVSLPILRKDFLIDPYQVYESKAAGADALLLIASILSFKRLQELYALTRSLGMDALVETHTKKELADAIRLKAKLIGINARDLKTFHVDLALFDTLARRIPKGTIIVAESGIKTREDVLFMQEHGAHAVLVGSALMQARDIGAKLRELRGINEDR